MKKIIAIAALAIAGTATLASATTLDTTANAAAIHQYAPNADLSNLSDEKILAALSAASAGGSQGEIRTTVRALVGSGR
ncbi:MULTISPECIES: hypothetical protein [unclassified Marinovum]